MIRNSVPGSGQRFSEPPKVSERIWGTSSSLPNRSSGKMGRGLKLVTQSI
jgi:hypothetical protein